MLDGLSESAAKSWSEKILETLNKASKVKEKIIVRMDTNL